MMFKVIVKSINKFTNNDGKLKSCRTLVKRSEFQVIVWRPVYSIILENLHCNQEDIFMMSRHIDSKIVWMANPHFSQNISDSCWSCKVTSTGATCRWGSNEIPKLQCLNNVPHHVFILRSITPLWLASVIEFTISVMAFIIFSASCWLLLFPASYKQAYCLWALEAKKPIRFFRDKTLLNDEQL